MPPAKKAAESSSAERRKKRWVHATAVEQLSPTRRRMLALIDGLDNAWLVIDIALLTCVGLWHIVFPAPGFDRFVEIYSRWIRDYYLIAKTESGEYGMWPGILSAFAQDVVFTLLLLVPIYVLSHWLRRQVLADPTPIREVVSDHIATMLGLTTFVYAVGVIAGTFTVLFFALAHSEYGTRVVFDTAASNNLVEPIASGILLTDLALAALIIWEARASSPRPVNQNVLAAAGVAAGVCLYLLVQFGGIG